VLYIVRTALHPFFANLIAVIIAGAMWLCGLASITSMARVCFAFGRDGGLPGSPWLSQVSHRWGTPVNAIIATSLLVVIVTFYSATYAVVTSMSTTALYLAYIIPVLLNYRNKRRQRGEFTTRASAPWSLGKYGLAINLVSIVWVALITMLFSIPPNELAGLTMIGLGAILFLYWQLSQKRHFRGPPKVGSV
jgi:amino acid transporter